VHPNQAFLQKFSNSFGELQKRNLSTLMLFGPHDLDFANTFRQEFIEGKSVRVLKLDMVISDLDLMIQNISSFINLRYLELGFFYKGDRLELPEAICKLHYLQVLNIGLIIGLPLQPAQHSVLPLEQNGAQFCH
jgi:hypothetical protein